MKTARLVFLLVLGCATAGAAMPSALTRSGSMPHVPLPVDSGSFMLDTTPAGYDASASVQQPDAAFNGHENLLAWCDVAHTNVWARRVGIDGLPSDTAPFSVVTGAWDVRTVAGLDTGWIVVWMFGSIIKTVRIGAHGQVVDLVPLNVGFNATDPATAASDSFYLAVWQDLSTVNDLYSALVRPNGSVTAAARIPTGSSRAHPRRRPAVAAGRGSFLVAFDAVASGDTAICGVLLDSTGHAVDSIPVTISGEGECGGSPSVAFDGTNYLVVWRRGNTSQADIVGKRVAPDGASLDREAFVISSAPGLQTNPKVQRQGDAWFVVWDDSRNGNGDVYGCRVSDDGTVLDPAGIAVSTTPATQQSSRLASGDTSCLIVWQDDRLQPRLYGVYGRPVSLSGVPILPETPLAVLRWRYSKQTSPAVAYGDSAYLIVWEDDGRGTGRSCVRGALVTSSGRQVLPPFTLSQDAGSGRRPTVAFCESLFLVAWTDSGTWVHRRVRAARVTPAGTVLDPGGFVVGYDYYYDSYNARASSCQGRWLIAWCNATAGVIGTNVTLDGYVARQQGVWVGPGDNNFALAGGTWLYLLAGAVNDPQYPRLKVMRTSADGVPIDTTTMDFGAYQLYPSIAAHGTNFLVCSNNGNRVQLDLVSHAGERMRSVSFTGGDYGTCGAPTGDEWLVVWQTLQRGGELSAARFTESLEMVDTAFEFDAGAGHRWPVCVGGPARYTLVAFPCSTTSVAGQPVNCDRVYGKFFVDSAAYHPNPLWPPEGYHFVRPPVRLQIEPTSPPSDSFEFLVQAWNNRDTVWRCRQVAPCCTVPDSVLSTQYRFAWRVRAHLPNWPWGVYTGERQFYIDYISGVEAQDGLLPELALAAVTRPGLREIAAEVSGIGAGAELLLYDMTGRKVWFRKIDADGVYACGPRAAGGARLGPGVYFLRLRASAGTITRKLVLP